MAAVIEAPPVSAPATPADKPGFAPRPYRLSVREYEQMIEAGIFHEDQRIELINGVLIEMSPKNAPHSSTVRHANYTFLQIIGDLAVVITQDVIVLNDNAEPEPDLVLLRPPMSRYDQAQPTAADVLLVLEVSDTTLRYDRETKGLAYAAAGIPQYVILNVNAREAEDYREPGADGYRAKRTCTAEQDFALVAFPDKVISVRALFPERPGAEAV